MRLGMCGGCCLVVGECMMWGSCLPALSSSGLGAGEWDRGEGSPPVPLACGHTTVA